MKAMPHSPPLSGQNTQVDAASPTPLAARAGALNARFAQHAAQEVMHHAMTEMGRVALVSSFGAESVVLLHMAALIDRHAPVLFLDTGFHFTETLVYQIELAERLGLTGIRHLRAPEPASDLPARDPDTCCATRKTAPLRAALADFDGWITGRKRFQSGRRAGLDFFEPDPGGNRLKINPLAHWRRADVADYMTENRLPRHPLVAHGYRSIGCAPCTTATTTGEPARAGRWRNTDRDECGIHLTPDPTPRGIR